MQQAINAGQQLLPAGLPAPPTYAKVNPADQPILTLAVSRSRCPDAIQDLADNRLAQKISRSPGVGLVTTAAATAGRARRSGTAKARRVRPESRRSAHADLRTSTSASRRATSTVRSSTTRSTRTIRSSTRRLPEHRDRLPERRAGHLPDVATSSSRPRGRELGAWVETHARHHAERARQPGANVIASGRQHEAVAALKPSAARRHATSRW